MDSSKVIWCTSFNEAIYKVSGKKLIQSFFDNQVIGELFLGLEDVQKIYYEEDKIKQVGFYEIDISSNGNMSKFLKANKDIIPVSLGGEALPCKCPDPWERRDFKHKTKGCYHTWWNRNMFKWFRKIATLIPIVEQNAYDYVIWLDADCVFTRQITLPFIEDFLLEGKPNKIDACYLKSSKRRVMEAGFVLYNFKAKGRELLQEVINLYMSGDFRKLVRWDDSYVIQKIMFSLKYKCRDIATTTDGKYSGVFKNSLIGEYITHNKGSHFRDYGLIH